MMDGLGGHVLTPAQRERLHSLADVVDEEPLASFTDDRAARVLDRCEVLLGHWGCPRLDADALTLAPRLQLVAYAAGTVKDVVSPELWDRGIQVSSAAAANAVPVAEFTLAAILFANKGVFASREWLRDPGVRIRRPKVVGNYDKQVGIVGASHVGRAVIDRLAPFSLGIVVADPFLTEADADELGVRRVTLDELLRTSHVVSLHAPDVPATRHMIGAAQLAMLGDGTTLINTARGRLVDTEALEAEVSTGRISAVLDVTDPEPLPRSSVLHQLPNVFLTPHLAGAQGSELGRLADLALDEVERFATGLPLRHPIRREDLDRIA